MLGYDVTGTFQCIFHVLHVSFHVIGGAFLRMRLTLQHHQGGEGFQSFLTGCFGTLIIVQINRIDEGIHQRLPLVFQAHIQLAEPQQAEPDELLCNLGLCQLFFRNAGFKLTLGFFQLL